MMRKIVAVIGDADIRNDSFKAKIAFETGKAVVDCGFRVQCGGMGGVMTEACRGARASANYKEGDTIGIIPTFDIRNANEFVDIAIPTGLDVGRNVIVAAASAVIVVGGGAGTMCEIAHAWELKRLIMAYSNVEGWSKKVAGTKLDYRDRYPDIENDRVYEVTAADDVKRVLKLIDKYVTVRYPIGINGQK